jgi:hypothetical protein
MASNGEEREMHAVFMTFEFSGEHSDVSGTFASFADTLTDERELVTRTWLNDGSTIGAFYVFRTTEAAEQFVRGERLRALAMHPDVSDFYIRHFATLGAVSAALPHTPVLLRGSDGISGEACPIWQRHLDHPAAQLVEHS